MYEKVNPSHPDKVADRIAGALVDLAYKKKGDPKVAVEVLIGHNKCLIINETDTHIRYDEVYNAVERITKIKGIEVDYKEVAQDTHLNDNQQGKLRCGDNGIFKGVPTNKEEQALANYARDQYLLTTCDGKYIYDQKKKKIVICQSNCDNSQLVEFGKDAQVIFNPLGYWTGGINVDSGATNRKLGSDMGRGVTGGGLHGKDLSKADVSVNIYAYLKAQKTGKTVEINCAIGDEKVDGKSYSDIVEKARNYIKKCGGFEKFAEWGLIRGDLL